MVPTAGEAPLTVEEFVLIKRTLNKRVLDRARLTPEWPVQVESCTHHNGRVRVICSDERSLGWVREEAKKLVPGPGSRKGCLLYTSPSPRDKRQSRMPSSA